VLVVKVGGGDLDLDAIARDLADLARPFVLLHGANKLRDEWAGALGRPPRVVESISGYQSVLSDDDAIDVLMAAYAGVRNKRLVEALRRAGVDAVGLTGLDGGLVRGRRNQGIRVMQEGRKLLLRDNSGKPQEVNGELLRTLLERGYAPVITVPIAGEDGSALNTENDEVLAHLAAELGATDVISLIEAPGLLADRHDPASVVPRVDPAELEEWEARVEGRMRRKIRALRSLFELAEAPGPRFRLGDGRLDRPVSRTLAGEGTIVARDEALAAGGPAASSDTSAGWLERQARHELDVYGKRGLTLVSGEGAVVRDAEGHAYLDCIGGHGALALGHRHPALVTALQQEAERLWFVPGSFGSPARVRLLERLHAALPPELSRTFLSNSGAEAVEAALKIARAHTGREDFVAAVRGFHGRTFGALSITSEAHYRDPFGTLLGEVRRVPFNDGEALHAAIDERVAAVVLEPVQGEGGVHVAAPDFLRAARAACDERGALLVFDEVQTGFGRTGRLFAFEHSGVVPDVLCLAKSIAGGLPLGATVVRDGIVLPPGTHGSTFGGNPLAAAVAAATLDVFAGEAGRALLAGAEERGARLAARIRDAAPAQVREVRQIGLMIGIQMRRRVRDLLGELQRRGVLALSAGASVLRLLPPLVITDDEIDRVGDVILEALAAQQAD
jgi:acetylornithine/LysW-gamma-L-lysine aminotransferase